MKNVAYIALLVLLLACLIAVAPPAYAQKATANVPFDYMAAGVHFPAGTYTVATVSDSFVRLTGNNQSAYMIAYATETLSPSPSSKLVFRCNGNTCSLVQIWTAGSAHGIALSAAFEKPSVVLEASQAPVYREIAAK
jgi:hypothetical protein